MKKGTLIATAVLIALIALIASTAFFLFSKPSAEIIINEDVNYREIETSFTKDNIGDFFPHNEAGEEMARMEKKGVEFWYDSDSEIEMKENIHWEDYEVKGEMIGEDTVYLNGRQVFSAGMFFGADGPVLEASMIMDSPAFAFREFKGYEDDMPIGKMNIWYKGETFNEKYEVEESYYPFTYNNKIGFFAKQDDKTFLIFDGQKISGDFDEVRTYTCCAIMPYPVELDSSGTLFFLAKRGEGYYFVELGLY